MKWTPRRTLAAAVLLVCAIFLLLDRVLFGWAIFLPENRSGWDSHRWYNFEYHFRTLSSRKTGESRPLVLIIGSSIAQYSVQPEFLEAHLRQRYGVDARVEMLTHAAMLPSDLYHYRKRIARLHPDLIVYLTNPADLDLERYSPPWEGGPPYSNDAELDYLNMRVPMLIFYPGRFALENIRTLPRERTVSLLFRGLFYSIRFRDEWYDPLLFDIQANRGDLKRYLYYQGVYIPEGIFREGATGGCFSAAPSSFHDGMLSAEIPQELFTAGLTLELYRRPAGNPFPEERAVWNRTADDRSILRYVEQISRFDYSRYRGVCRPAASDQKIGRLTAQKAGWQKFALPEIPENERYFIRLSHTLHDDGRVAPLQENGPSYQGKGIRLPGDFGLTSPRTDDYMVRRRGLEDIRLSSLTASQSVADYERRIQPTGWRSGKYRATISLNLMRLGKYYTTWFDFEPNLQARYLVRFFKSNEKTPVLIVNNPENPTAAGEYEGTRWYRGYLRFMEHLADERSRHSLFLDLHERLAEHYFIDPHHLTYDGMVVMSPVYAEQIARLLSQPKTDPKAP